MLTMNHTLASSDCTSSFVDDVMFSHSGHLALGIGSISVGAVVKFPTYAPRPQ